jgi:hypothetical protein
LKDPTKERGKGQEERRITIWTENSIGQNTLKVINYHKNVLSYPTVPKARREEQQNREVTESNAQLSLIFSFNF